MVWAVCHWSLIVEMLKGLASCGVAGEEKPHKSLTVPADFDQKHDSQPGLHRGYLDWWGPQSVLVIYCRQTIPPTRIPS